MTATALSSTRCRCIILRGNAFLPNTAAIFPEEKHYSWGGMPTEEIIATLNAEQGLAMNPVEVALQKEEYYYEILHQLQAVPEVLEHIEAIHGTIPFAVVSGGTRDSVTTFAERAGYSGQVRRAGLRG